MKFVKRILAIFIFAITTSNVFSQDTKFLDSIPTTKDGFVATEPAVINTIDWLENTPIGQEPDKRKLLYSKFLAWLTNSPTVSIEINSKTAGFTKKNPDLLFIFMGGWTRYTLQNSYSNDAVKCNVAGIKSAIKVYQMGNGMKKDKDMDKIIAMDSKNELEAWVNSQLAQK